MASEVDFRALRDRCHGLESLASPGTGQSENIPSIKWISPATASGKHRSLCRFFCRSIVHMDSRVLERPPVANFSRAELQKERAAMARTSHFVQTLALRGCGSEIATLDRYAMCVSRTQ